MSAPTTPSPNVVSQGADQPKRRGWPVFQSVRSRLWLVCGLLLALLAFGGAAFLNRFQELDGRFARVAEVTEPKSAATYEIEINVVESSLKVLKHLAGGDSTLRAGLNKDLGQVKSFPEQYARLADDPTELAAARNLRPPITEFERLAHQLVSQRDKIQGAEDAVRAEIRKLDRILDQQLQPAVEQSGDVRKMRRVVELEVDIMAIS